MSLWRYINHVLGFKPYYRSKLCFFVTSLKSADIISNYNISTVILMIITSRKSTVETVSRLASLLTCVYVKIELQTL